MAEDFDVEAMLEAPYVKSVSVIHFMHIASLLGDVRLARQYIIIYILTDQSLTIT